MSFFDSDEEDDNSMRPSQQLNKEVIRIAQPFEDQMTKTTRMVNKHLESINEFQVKNKYATFDPLKPPLQVLDASYEDHMGMFNLVQTPDHEFGKIIIVFSYLDNEINKSIEKFEQTMYDGLVTYGIKKEATHETPKEKDDIDIITSSGEKELQISKMLDLFKELFDLIKRVSSIILNLVNQLHAIYFEKDRFFKNTFKNFQLHSVIESLSKACGLILTIDLIMKETPQIRQDFARFKAQAKNMAKEPARYKVTDIQLKKLERILNKFDKTILSGQCFLGTISQNFDQKTEEKSPFTAPASAKSMKDNEDLYDLFTDYMKLAIDYGEIIGTPGETFERKQLFNNYALYALYRKLFPKQEDRDIWKKLWYLQKKAPVIIVQSHLVFDIADYLNNFVQLTKKASSKDPKDSEAYLEEFIEKKDDNFEKEMTAYYDQFRGWATQMDSFFGGAASLSDPRNFPKSCAFKIRLLFTGLVTAAQIRQNVMTMLFLHVKKAVAFTEPQVASMLMGCMVLKGIKHIIDENLEGMPPFFLMEQNSVSIREKLTATQAKIKKGSAKQEIYQAIELMKDNLAGPGSSQRFSVIFTCLSFLCPKKDKLFKDAEFEEFRYEIWRQKILSRYQSVFREACDCSFLYWTKDLIPLFYGYIGDHPIEMKRLKFLNLAIQDCQVQLVNAKHTEKKGQVLEWFKDEVFDYLHKEILRKICNQVDEHLRLLMHSMLIEKLKGKNPFETPTKPVHHYLVHGPIEIFGNIIDPIEHVSNYLDENFYNLNVLNLHDYETYEGLRNLAEHLFGVDLLHPYIPSQSIEKGNVDVLNIMRGISGFVSKFNYNMYTQTFVESTKDSKLLNTVGIQQIADSVQTHGAGILNTSANVVYTFILKKFNVFSQFLFDELVQSPLLRETKTFRENKEAWDGKYPYNKADTLQKEIKRLGVFEDGKTFLDKFRLLITTIGNSLGFVRLLRTAGLSYCSKQIEYLPYKITFLEEGELNENYYEELARNGGFSGPTIGSGHQLDDVIKTLKNNFTERTDYLRLLVKNFEGMFTGQEYKHLKVFYIMIPALTLNYVEACIAAKEKVSKKMAPDSYIFDDGFALGAAYFLRLLGQDTKFDSLHWFDELKKKFDGDLKVLKENQAENSKKSKKERDEDEDLELNLQMSAKKISQQVDEFNYFKCTFQTARILFREVGSETRV